MFYKTEYPKIYSACNITLDIFTKPIVWFKPLLGNIGQLMLYRFKVKPNEDKIANELLQTQIIKMNDGTELMLGVSKPSNNPRAIVLYLHTVCGDYKQLGHFAEMFKDQNITYITYTRSGNDPKLKFKNFNFVGDDRELQIVIKYITNRFPNIPIHAMGASAGSALLIRHLAKYNDKKIIKSAILISPGYDFIKSYEKMSHISQAYLVNKMKYLVRNVIPKEKLSGVKTLNDWINLQSNLLGYDSSDTYIKNCDPVHFLHKINVPTLFISSMDDNIFSGEITKQFIDLPSINPNVIIATTELGGHVMFEDDGHSLSWFQRVVNEWINNRIVAFELSNRA